MTSESPIRDLARQIRALVQGHPAYPQVALFMNHVQDHLAALAYAEEVNQARQTGEPMATELPKLFRR